MAGQSKGRKLREMLGEKADWLLEQLASGRTVHEVAKEIEVWPAQIVEFFTLQPELRDRYRMALVKQAAMNVIVVAKEGKTGRPKKGSKPKTNAEIVADHESEILLSLFDGETVLRIAEGLMVRRADIAAYFKANEDRAALYADAMLEGGAAMAEKAIAVGEGVALDATDAKVMAIRANGLQWLAAKRNAQYDNRQAIDLKGQVSHSISIDISTD
jgi:hypothetical protein